ncbi:hypothetical protein FRC17_009592 [Serendipita sp. 399]|nr:hypothetical protein FRC17_009592 [Serendipita sp. 399]
MGNTASSTPPSSQGHHPPISPVGNSKITLVYDNTPTLIYRPATYKEALEEARSRFLLPQHAPVELSCKYLTVGYIVLNELNWESIAPTIHTLFVAVKSTPPPPPASTATTPQPSTSHLQLSPFQPTGALSSPPLPAADAPQPTASTSKHPPPEGSSQHQATLSIPSSSFSTPKGGVPQPTSLQPLKINSHEMGKMSPLRPTSLLPSSSHSPVTSTLPAAISPPSSSRPLPVPPNSPPHPSSSPILSSSPPLASATTPEPAPAPAPAVAVAPVHTSSSTLTPAPAPAPSSSPPSSSSSPHLISFTVRYSENGRNTSFARGGERIRLTLPPTTTTIQGLKDILADRFVVPVYVQQLWVNRRPIDTNENWTLQQVGVGDGSIVVVTRT